VLTVAQDKIGRARRVDRADAGELPVEPDVAQEERAGDLVVGVVVKHEAAGVDVTQQHVAFVATAEVAEPRHLPIQSHGAEEYSGRNLVVADSRHVPVRPAELSFPRVILLAVATGEAA
jgi:hypothetical protein